MYIKLFILNVPILFFKTICSLKWSYIILRDRKIITFNLSILGYKHFGTHLSRLFLFLYFLAYLVVAKQGVLILACHSTPIWSVTLSLLDRFPSP